jgi:murein DD-endopeptidase MepM/ murein hydrolase activator NlpD
LVLLVILGSYGLRGHVSAQGPELVVVPLPLPAVGELTAIPGEPVTHATDPDAVDIKVSPGDSLARIFGRLGLSAADVHAVVNASPEARRLANLMPGRTVTVARDVDGALMRVDYELSESLSLRVARDGSAFTAEIVEQPIERRISFAEGTISSSLFLAARQAGLSDGLTMTLAERIFGWDIDFALEIREGDSFRVIYDEIYRDGERLGDGAILAAEFVNRGRTFRAVYFVDDDGRAGYYAPDGRAMRKAFLRAPLDFTRISSHFNPNRRHPVLNTIRAHRGVDYAAPTGTPIRAAGDGRVIRRAPYGGYGNAVEIQHGGGITTLYAHMSRFRRGVGVGTRVTQGQIVGYVGMTGLANGPHLHYEFRLNGTHRNPLTVSLPAADPLPERHRERFDSIARPLLAHLEAMSAGARVVVADTRQP